MMDPRAFLEAAWEFLKGSHESEWRSATSRAYYAAFHVARQLLCQAGFAVPRADQAHAYLWYRLSHCGHPDVSSAGVKLNDLRRARNRADYDLDLPIDERSARDHAQMAADIIELLDDLSREAAILARVVEAIKVYERDVLREVTWHS